MDAHKVQDVVNKQRGQVLDSSKKKYDTEGVNEGLKTVKYKLKKMVKSYLYTHFVIDHPMAF
jgi:hypothetical protein